MNWVHGSIEWCGKPVQVRKVFRKARPLGWEAKLCPCEGVELVTTVRHATQKAAELAVCDAANALCDMLKNCE